MLLLNLFVAVSGQNETILTVAGEDVTKADFESIFKKNNRDSAITKESLDEYMELFINFKLKVAEAKALGLDTNQAFIKELAGYRRQLSRPYLVDNALLDEIIETAYKRKKEEIRASHILISVDPNSSPEDTLRAWNRIMKLRERIVGGEDFEKVARSKAGSEDPSVKNNGGDLGYFSVFQMVYPFEDAAYKLEIGEVSQPVRTRYGYHIIKLTDRRPARGEVEVAHIMVKVKDPKNQQESLAAQKRITEIYQQIKAGADFGVMAMKHSDDRSSGKDNGKLPWFGTGKMVPEFEEVAFNTSVGEVSEPFLTQYGWHIIKGLDHKPVPEFKDVEAELKTKVSRDARSEKTTESFLNKLRKEYNVTEHPKALQRVVTAADTGLWEGMIEVKAKYMDDVILEISDKDYFVKDYVDYLSGRKQNRKRSPERIVKERFEAWEEAQLLDYEDSQLERKHNAFRLLMNEYRDGILLFELTDQKVWSKAVEDTTGLEAYYEEHKNDYMWPERFNASIYTCANEKIAKKLRKMLTKGKSLEEIKTKLNADSELNVREESGIMVVDEQPVLKEIPNAIEVSRVIPMNDQFYVVDVEEYLPPTPKALNEARGLVTADYQKYLEDQWVEELRDKYDFKVNRDVLYSIH